MKRLKDLKRKGGGTGAPSPDDSLGAPGGDAELDALFSDLDDGGGGDDPFGGGDPGKSGDGGLGADLFGGGGGGLLGSVSGEDVEILKNSLRKIEVGLESVRGEMNNLGDRQNVADKNIEDLLMIYELVAKQFNPFAAKGDMGIEGGLHEGAGEASPLAASLEDAPRGGLPETGAEQMAGASRQADGEIGGAFPGGKGIAGEFPAGPEADTRGFGEEAYVGVDEYGRPLHPAYGPGANGGAGAEEHDRFGRGIPRKGPGASAEPPRGLPRIEIGGRWKAQPVLPRVGNDYASVVLALRWIEFLFERVKRNNISALLDYYEDIGWISNEVKSNIMAYARGTIQDISAYDPDLEENAYEELSLPDGSQALDDKGKVAHRKFRKISEWKLSAEDHLKSLLFIKKMAGSKIDKDELNALEQEIKVMKYSFRRYHEV